MSPKNTTIGEVLGAVSSLSTSVNTLSNDSKAKFTEVFEVVQAQGQQIGEVLEAVHLLATQMEVRFGQVNERFESMEQRFESMDSRVTSIASQMVTKHYLDDKLADLRE